MDRLPKKCFIASGIVHGTLVLLLIVGPAFLPSESKQDSLPPMTFIPLVATESGAYVPPKGVPDAGRQSPQPEVRRADPPQPPPRPVPPVKEPQKEPPRDTDDNIKNVEPTPRKDPNALDPNAKARKTPLVNVSNVVTRKQPKDTASKNTATADDAKARADQQRKLKEFQEAANAISGGAGKSVGDVKLGDPNGEGEGQGQFIEILKSIYFNNWREPSDATVEDGVVKVTVTVARDGSVMSARITKSSGDPAVDRSVQRTLDSVKKIVPFPPGWKESERQFPISFSLKAKRSIG